MPRAADPLQLVPREQAVLLLLGGTDNDDEVAAALRRVRDWQGLLTLVSTERAAAELDRRVRQVGDAGVPGPVCDALHRLAMVSEFEMAYLQQRLDEALRALQPLDARIMLLKGAALVVSVYGGDFRRRPMADVDLLVDASRAEDVRRTLLAAEWHETIAPGRTNAYEEHHHLPPLRDARGSRAHLEVHTALFRRGHPFGLTPDVLWRRAEPVSFDQMDASAGALNGVYVPAVEHQLLHLCVHFAWSHVMRFGAWRAARDVGALIASGRIDWDAFVRLARESRAATCCYWTFRLAALFKAPAVPAEVSAALRPRRLETLLDALERHYVLNVVAMGGACPSVRVDRALWSLGVLPTQSGHERVRPWDRDAIFIGTARDPAELDRPVRVARVWRAVRYLFTVAGVAAVDRPEADGGHPDKR